MFAKWYPHKDDPQMGVFIQKHARAIAKRNSIAVLSVHPEPKLSKSFEISESQNEGVNEIRVYYRSSQASGRKIINPLRHMIAWQKGIRFLKSKNSKPDILHAYILARTAIIAKWLSMRMRIPYVISEQWSGYANGKYLKSASIKKIITANLTVSASAFTTVSVFLLNRIKASGLKNETFRVIPNVVESFSSPEEIEKHPFVSVLLVADLVDEIKNISGVIRMIHKSEANTPFKLYIIGRGPDETSLKNLAAGYNLLDRQVFFEGIKSNEEVYEYLHRCDFLVMNSRYETFSSICAEALSCGKPVIATRCGGPNEFITDECGYLIETDNESELSKEFHKMLETYFDFDQKKIKDYAQKKFSMEYVTSAFQDVYDGIMQAN